jgi:hypothetical protein
MPHSLPDDQTLTYLLYAGGVLILCVPIIHFVLRFIKEKRDEEKERQMILKQILEDRKKDKEKEKAGGLK